MRALKCDRCGRYVDVPRDDVALMGIRQIGDAYAGRHHLNNVVDICDPCYEQFEAWLNPAPSKVADKYLNTIREYEMEANINALKSFSDSMRHYFTTNPDVGAPPITEEKLDEIIVHHGHMPWSKEDHGPET